MVISVIQKLNKKLKPWRKTGKNNNLQIIDSAVVIPINSYSTLTPLLCRSYVDGVKTEYPPVGVGGRRDGVGILERRGGAASG